MDPNTLDAHRESEHAIVEGRPFWATGGFTLSIFGGAIGCILLLLRKRIAHYALIASLVSTIVTMTHTLSIDVNFGAGGVIKIVAIPLARCSFFGPVRDVFLGQR
jgi:hypothetical protein